MERVDAAAECGVGGAAASGADLDDLFAAGFLAAFATLAAGFLTASFLAAGFLAAGVADLDDPKHTGGPARAETHGLS